MAETFLGVRWCRKKAHFGLLCRFELARGEKWEAKEAWIQSHDHELQ
jgi:hypothetical protein